MYKRMDNLIVFITQLEMFFAMPDKTHKYVSIEGNEIQHEILMKCPDATREEFEKLLKTTNSNDAFAEFRYWAKIEQK